MADIDKGIPLMTPTFFDDNDPDNPKRKTYIEREAVLKHALLENTRLSDNAWQRGYWHGVDVMAEFIKEQPTADVVEVRHGEWIPIPEYENKRCSVCSAVFSDFTLGYYCPNCGAKMDGDDSE